MPQIIVSGSVNLAGLTAPDLYVQVLNPPSFIRGVPTDVIGNVGTASWGPVNLPVHSGSGQDAQSTYGPITSQSLFDPYDLPTDLYLAFSQSTSQATLEAFSVRVTDGTDTKASLNLTGAATATPQTATISGTVTAGDTLQLTATSTALAGSPITVSYTATASDTLTTLAAALANAVNNNLTLNTAAVFASSVGAVATLYWPASLSPTIVWTRNVTGAATETITISPGSVSTAGCTVQALYTGTLGSQIKLVLSSSPSVPNSTNVQVTGFAGPAEIFPNIGNANFWRNLQSAFANGITNYRGPSKWVRVSTLNAAVAAPILSTYSLAGGTDGRAGVTTSTLLGSSTANPRTGIWALSNTVPAVGIAWLAGSTDQTAIATMDQFALSAGCSVLFPFPVGTSTATAVAGSLNNGVAGPEFIYVKDFIYFNDTVNNIRRLVAPTPVIGGTWATFSPEQSPLNKKVLGVVGTERNDPTPGGNGNIPYTESEIGQLNSAGVLTITNPVPGGNYFGIRQGASTSPLASTAPVEWWRLTMFIARSIDQNLGVFVGQLQGQHPHDKVRDAVKSMLNGFAVTLENDGIIDSGIGFCEFTTSPTAVAQNGYNTPSSVAQHFLFALFQATYLSSVWFFVCSIQGGTTVVTVSPGGQA